MGDMLRVFDSVSSGKQQHLLVMYYKQSGNIKEIKNVIELDITGKRELLFGDLTREDIEELDGSVKVVPHKQHPTKEQHQYMYGIRDEKKKKTGSIIPNIKCDGTQSRLQCSFNKFKNFIDNNPSLVVEQSINNIFHNIEIETRYYSPPRKFLKKGCNKENDKENM